MELLPHNLKFKQPNFPSAITKTILLFVSISLHTIWKNEKIQLKKHPNVYTSTAKPFFNFSSSHLREFIFQSGQLTTNRHM